MSITGWMDKEIHAVEYYSATKRNDVLIGATRHWSSHVIWFCLCEMFRKDTSIETESRLIVAWVRKGEAGWKVQWVWSCFLRWWNYYKVRLWWLLYKFVNTLKVVLPFKWVNLMISELHLKKNLKLKKVERIPW